MTKRELRSSAWQQLFRGIYADASLTISHRTRCAAAARYLLPAGAAIAGHAAVALYGGVPLHEGDPIEVLVPYGMRLGPHRGLTIHTGRVNLDEVSSFAGIPVTVPERTCGDVVRWRELTEAVVLIDSLLANRVVTVARLRAHALADAGERGWRQLLRAADLADGGAESPQESRLRVRLVLAGLPRPVTQFAITRNGVFVARVDLAWPELRVAVEYDGEWHAEPGQFHQDRRRLNRILGSDWIVLHVTARRLREDFDGFADELRAVLKDRARPDAHRIGA